MRTFDSNYANWKAGDKVVWCDKCDICPLFTITEINASARWAFWEQSERRQGSQWENLIRVTEIESDKTNMTDLEKLINELLEIPSHVLVGDEDTVTAQWASSRDGSVAFIKLGEWSEIIYLDPIQALALLDYLGEQRQNLENLRDALQAKQIEDEATKELREAERLNALKALHSDAVVAWQQGGCVGSCPSFEDIVFKEQFVRVDLDGNVEAIPVAFVKNYPMLERMREGQRG